MIPGFDTRSASRTLDRNSHAQVPLVTTQSPPPLEPPAPQLLEQLLRMARLSALEEMASGIAHELNQPIGAITTFAQAGERMLDRPDPMVRQTVDVLRHISAEALNAGAGIRRIRGLFAHESRLETCSIVEVIAELMPVLELLAERNRTTLERHVVAELPPISIDRLRIQHVLFTLVQNALESPAREDTSPRVRIEVTGDRYGVQVAVVDQGSGVPEHVRKNLFRPFFTTKGHGTGLGLASSRAIVEAHEGSIGFDETQAVGARFWFRLPAAAP